MAWVKFFKQFIITMKVRAAVALPQPFSRTFARKVDLKQGGNLRNCLWTAKGCLINCSDLQQRRNSYRCQRGVNDRYYKRELLQYIFQGLLQKPCWQKIKKTACKCRTVSIIKVQCNRFKIHKLCWSTQFRIPMTQLELKLLKALVFNHHRKRPQGLLSSSHISPRDLVCQEPQQPGFLLRNELVSATTLGRLQQMLIVKNTEPQ